MSVLELVRRPCLVTGCKGLITNSHPDAYLCDACEAKCHRKPPPFSLQEQTIAAHKPAQLGLSIDLRWSELKPKRPAQQSLDGELFGDDDA